MIDKFVWRDEYSVGIPSIDDQHKQFFLITDEIIDLLLKKDKTMEELRASAFKLGDYASYHLKTEEGYFDHLNYPDAPRHVHEHDLYRQKVAYYLRELEKPEVDVPRLAEEIANYSITWLSHHILQTDKQYTIFFQEHGVK